MRRRGSESSVFSVWPLFTGGVVFAPVIAALAWVSFVNTPVAPPLVTPHGELVDLGACCTWSLPDRGKTSSVATLSPASPSEAVAKTPVSEAHCVTPARETESTASEIDHLIADWRYTGGIRGKGASVAVVERAREPGKTFHLKEGDTLDRVSIEGILPGKLVVHLGEEQREIAPSQGAAFDLSRVEVPEDLADDPDLLAAAVFAQTLGAYVPVGVADSVQEGQESDEEMARALAEENYWPSPSAGQELGPWMEQLIESGSLMENLTGQSSPPALSETERLKILGF